MRDICVDAGAHMDEYCERVGDCYIIRRVWNSGKIARLSFMVRGGRRKYRMGERVQYAGVWARVIDPQPWAHDGVLVRRIEGWWSLPLCGWYWIRKHILMPVSCKFWRTVRACHLLVDYDPGSYVSWGNFRPYRWLLRL